MQTNSILYLVLATILALVVVYFQYYFRGKQKGKTRIILTVLRFFGVFGLLLLLINPKFSKKSFTLEKPNLVFLVDNSSSVKGSEELVQQLTGEGRNNTDVSERFEISSYQFGEKLRPFDTLSFAEKRTNIQQPLATLNDVFARRNTAIVLISDGNQNIGKDYSLSGSARGAPIYTVTVGDTTRFEDLSIGPINTNTYAFLNNKYPLETYVTYQGNGKVKAKLAIKVDGATVFQELITLSKTTNLKNIKTLINANKVGVKAIEISIDTLNTERNTVNNTRTTAVEVISEKTKITIVSELLHPDIGALKKAIESNEQREVAIVKPSMSTQEIEETDIFILYQPNASFKAVFDFIAQKQSNFMIVTGTQTDYRFLNGVQSEFQIETGYPGQEVFGNLNTGFSKYDILDFDLSDFPPLLSNAGPVSFGQPAETLIGVTIKGLDMNFPLLSVYGSNDSKKGLLMGEGIWKWRMQSFRNSGDFSDLDIFLGKLIRYLSTDTARNRLNLTYNRNYEGSNTAYISATYFDETYVFDPNASLTITVTNATTKASQKVPMVLKNDYFEADLTSLPPGLYAFSANVKGQNYEERGSFIISDFDLEKQFVSSNYLKMQQLAQATGGQHFFPSEYKELLSELISSNSYVPTQKSTENVVSLIDFKILLGLIVLAFSLEWLIRKYNGLI